MSHPPLNCPVCRGLLKDFEIRLAGPFRCPTCGERLQIPSRYSNGLSAASLLISAVLSVTMGLRGVILCFVTVILWVPINILGLVMMRSIWPPKIERCLPKDLRLFQR
jgi:hypothetical protein